MRAEAFYRAVGIGGRKHGGEYRLGGEAVTAHPRYDPDTGRVCESHPHFWLYASGCCQHNVLNEGNVLSTH